ncbi:MAG: hypothetical protein M0Q88_07635 [Bacilli bacterium]|nr:hypothetical protein [Bacilli bacterium]
MKKILFLRDQKALYPEIDAYANYFNQTGEFCCIDSLKFKNEIDLKEFDIIWEIKGLGGVKVPDRLLIHDYASLSLAPLPRLKNFIKSYYNPKPNVRLFLNETVKAGFSFKDNIPFCFRDMGIGEEFNKDFNNKKEFEFVYVGAVSKKRKLGEFLNNYDSSKLGRICLVGPVDNDIYQSFKNNKDIIFTGRVDYLEVPSIASKAIYGLNLIPNQYPYNLQTSTKLLEYLALGLKVVSTDYQWVREFESKHSCSFYKVDYHFKIEKSNLDKFKFNSNFKAEDFLWEKVIEESGIDKMIKSLLK